MATAAVRARRDARIRELTAEGLSRREVAKRVGLSPAAVQYVLARVVVEARARPPARPPTRLPAVAAVERPRLASPARDLVPGDPGPSVRQQDRPDSYWHEVWQDGGLYGDAEGYKRGVAEATAMWRIAFPCGGCGGPIYLKAADASRLGVLGLLRDAGPRHVPCG